MSLEYFEHLANLVRDSVARFNMPFPLPWDEGTMVMAPPWLLLGLGATFLMGTLFYLFRLSNPAYLRKVNGYVDSENEFWHGVCLLAMVTSLTPPLAPVPTSVWLWGLPVGVLWYLYRAFTYGRRLPHNKQWYDFAHAAMLFGMWWMYAQPYHGQYVTWGFAAYWGWFGSYYVCRLFADLRKPNLLSFGQNVFHLLMALVMLVMTLWPNYLMVM
jgi:hypothetical protein